MQQARAAHSESAPVVDMEEGVRWGFRLLLGREPAGRQEVDAVLHRNPTPQALRSWLLHTREYRRRFETMGRKPVSEPEGELDLREAVIWGYRFYFDREPDGAAIDYQLARVASVRDVRELFLLSREFELCGGYGASGLLELEILGRFAPFCAVEAEPGFFHDFLGAKTRLAHLPAHFAFKSGTIEGGPNSPTRGMHSTAEWIGTLRSVLEAERSLVAIELGAGWAPWLVTVAAAAERRGISDLTLIAVEGSAEHVAFARQHFRDNGLDPDDYTILHAVVGAEDGVARFPKLADPSTHYGASAAFHGEDGLELPGYAGWEDLACVSLETILAELAVVDILHSDVQGAEAEIFTATIDRLNQSVRRIVVGTHSRQIDIDLLTLFSSHGWHLEFEQPCGLRQNDAGEMELTIDGEQVWRNPRFASGLRR